MNPWETVLYTFGGNAVLLTVLAFLAKSLLEKLIVHDTKVFESDLKAKTDAEIERLKNEMTRSLESYKIQLKKSEIFFQRELEAASAFSALFHSILPRHRNPTMDWSEACDSIAQDFGRIETLLGDFMSTHSAVLNADERSILTDAMAAAGYGKFSVLSEDVDSDANTKAGDLYETLKSLESKLISRVRVQASL